MLQHMLANLTNMFYWAKYNILNNNYSFVVFISYDTQIIALWLKQLNQYECLFDNLFFTNCSLHSEGAQVA